MTARAVIAGSVTGVTLRWLQGETGNRGYCRTNARADRSLCRVDVRVTFVHTWVFDERIQ
jgi:hypothetical protein